jgi:ribosomal protein S27AE
MRAESAPLADCPRCGAPLLAQGPNRQWLKFFECGQCWLAFEFVVEEHFEHSEHSGHAKGRRCLRLTLTLQPGRTARPADWMRK